MFRKKRLSPRGLALALAQVSLKATSSFPGSEEWESPSVRVWTLVFLAQHHSKLRHVVKAIGLIDEVRARARPASEPTLKVAG